MKKKDDKIGLFTVMYDFEQDIPELRVWKRDINNTTRMISELLFLGDQAKIVFDLLTGGQVNEE